MGKNGRIFFDRPSPQRAVVPVEEEEEEEERRRRRRRRRRIGIRSKSLKAEHS
jgi:hypothetical protein